MKNLKEYYKHIGRLAYLVAMADGVIQEEEKEQLLKSVLKDFAVNENSVDSSGMNQAMYVTFAFEESMLLKPNRDDVIRDFSLFIDQFNETSDGDLLLRSVDLLKKIAVAYTKNKETLIVDTVKNKIKKILAQ